MEWNLLTAYHEQHVSYLSVALLKYCTQKGPSCFESKSFLGVACSTVRREIVLCESVDAP